MLTPIFLIDRGDVAVFETARDLERYVESPDAAQLLVFDASGRRYYFKGYRAPATTESVLHAVTSVELDSYHPGPQEENELAALLRTYLRRLGNREELEECALVDLVSKTTEAAGFTR